MGLFSRFKRGGDEPSFDEVRSHVLGEEYPPLPPAPPAPPASRDFGDRPFAQSYPERGPMETPGFEMPDVSRGPIALEQKEDRATFEILDRLSMIEAQLAAIRSQTETINERLKNIDARLPRRY